jgi:hypothetical protein
VGPGGRLAVAPGHQVVQRGRHVLGRLARAAESRAGGLAGVQVDRHGERARHADGGRAAHDHVLDVRPGDLRGPRGRVVVVVAVVGKEGKGRQQAGPPPPGLPRPQEVRCVCVGGGGWKGGVAMRVA